MCIAHEDGHLLIRHSLTGQDLIEHRVIFPKSLALQACVLLRILTEANLRTGRGHACCV